MFPPIKIRSVTFLLGRRDLTHTAESDLAANMVSLQVIQHCGVDLSLP